MDILDDVEFQIAKLELGPDDVLAVRVARSLPSTVAAELRAQLERRIGHKVLVLDPDTELSVIGKSGSKRPAMVGKS